MITGINHITFSVKNLENSFNFYHKVLGFAPLAKWSKGCYFMAGNLWVALILDKRTRNDAMPEYTHTAFNIARKDFQVMSKKIINSGAIIWQENSSEGDSLYFLDPDGHKLEIHSTDLETRLKAARENPWEGMEFFD